MGATWGLSRLLRMGLPGSSRSSKVNTYGFLKHRMSNLKEGMARRVPGLKKILSFAGSNMLEVMTKIGKVIGASMLEGKSLSVTDSPTTAPTKRLDGTSLIGGTETRPRRTKLLGGTMPRSQSQRGVIKNEIVSPALATTRPPA